MKLGLERPPTRPEFEALSTVHDERFGDSSYVQRSNPHAKIGGIKLGYADETPALSALAGDRPGADGFVYTPHYNPVGGSSQSMSDFNLDSGESVGSNGSYYVHQEQERMHAQLLRRD